MKSKHFAAAFVLTVAAGAGSTAHAQEVLTGDTKLACEALLCLSTGQRPDECSPSIKKYLSISYRRLSDTLRGRLNFLKLCPASNQSPEMRAFVNAVSQGAGRCDAQALNTQRIATGTDGLTMNIDNQLPLYCAAYLTNEYTKLTDVTPRYVGIPERGGYWVEASEYDAALTAYKARIEAEDHAFIGISIN